MSTNLKVSVVITTHNSARTIARCLDSLLPYQQRGTIAEVIIVDSQSTDSTAEIVAGYPVTWLQEEGAEAYQHSPIRVFHSTYRALDQGWRHSCGDVVMFLDSDAYLGEGMFPQVREFFSDSQLAVLGGWQRTMGESRYARTMAQVWEFQGARIRDLQQKPTLWRRLYHFAAWFGSERLPIGGPCYLVRRKCLEEINGHDTYGDVGIAARLGERGWRILWWVDGPVYHLPRQTLRKLVRERYSWGFRGQIGAASLHKARHYVAVPLSVGWALFLGIFLAIRYRNPLHLVVHPLATMAHVAGAFVGRLARLRGAR